MAPRIRARDVGVHTALSRDDWLPLARKLDWSFSYVREEEVFPPEISGTPWLPHSEWADWDEPYRTTFTTTT